ncbi:MAG TPA: protein phosphatase [Cyanobacteria bacterium UBA11149]|nr:protein phosphatase [Cyanobacteria bacterium UBA11366]HBK63690.1 protein phosphatase [Cyanobacteria bacterium UBA11166]HBR72673.1 protein phosphatase [Cyanobacteria bacterium UBA11159]HBS71561.1 protein phosphatase [Cyanobacteria bacterium UBA11153]HBW90729.1 protein phosphatase [Cyanobacteria bacterium UBA11149]HCA97476.1 protein phosphatase [Cyanobacteria bacterium UBA9226]
MLICLQCKFENPNTNKFCQQCGTSLIHKICHECHAQVPVNSENCHKCNAFIGTVWRAILTQEGNLPLSQPDSLEEFPAELEKIPIDLGGEEELQIQPPVGVHREENEAESFSVKTITPPAAEDGNGHQSPTVTDLSSVPPQLEEKEVGEKQEQSSSEAIYLDTQSRYRLLEPPKLEESVNEGKTGNETFARVLDCQPFQKSPLRLLLESVPEAKNTESQSTKIIGIPAIANPYLALKKLYHNIIPDIHDAWEENGKSIVLLEDRSQWQLLSELWGGEDIPTGQILSWLDEMTELWQALEHWHCRQSLLEISNLRVDKYGVFCLESLYQEAQDEPLTLEDLGQTWRKLFSTSQRTQLTSLGTVFQDLCAHEITSVEELRSRLTQIATVEQAITVSPQPEILFSDFPVEEPREDNMVQITADESNSKDPTIILPMKLLSLDDVGRTDIGHTRDHNEDCFGIRRQVQKQETPKSLTVDARGLYILCDGMGGHLGGEIASAMAVESLTKYFEDHWQDQLPTEETIREAISIANQAIYNLNQQEARSGSARMGTTLVMILIQNTKVAIAHVGDSRVYRLTRRDGLEQLTIDHEVGQREIMRGVDPAIAYNRHDAYQLTQALGPRSDEFVNPDVKFLDLDKDTLFILCSDGLSDRDLIEIHWQDALAPLLRSHANLDQGVDRLIDLANEHNGCDNITSILIRVKVRPNFEQRF